MSVLWPTSLGICSGHLLNETQPPTIQEIYKAAKYWTVKRKKIIFMLIFFALHSSSDAAETYSYVDIKNNEGLRITRDPNFIIFQGHIGHQWSDCNYEPNCLISRDLVISLRGSADGVWAVGGFEFEGKSLGRISMLGRTFADAQLISSTQKTIAFQFLYSKHYGLLGISANDKNQRVELISKDLCAFGAARSCKD